MTRIASGRLLESARLSVRTPARKNAFRRGLRALIAGAAFGAAAAAQGLTFETGTLAGWTRTGTAFARQPTFGNNVAVRRPGETVGHAGDWWVGTYENRPGRAIAAGTVQGDAPVGTLLSAPFNLSRRFVQFLIGGGADITRVRAELLVQLRPGETAPPVRDDGVGGRIRLSDGDYTVRAVAAGADQELMRRAQWNVQADINRRARIRVIDNSSGPWAISMSTISGSAMRRSRRWCGGRGSG